MVLIFFEMESFLVIFGDLFLKVGYFSFFNRIFLIYFGWYDFKVYILFIYFIGIFLSEFWVIL